MEPIKDFVCLHCKHLDQDNLVSGFYCSAFDDEIPDDIIDGKHDHKTPYPGDHGIMFEPKD